MALSFDDLIPKSRREPLRFDDLIPNAAVSAQDSISVPPAVAVDPVPVGGQTAGTVQSPPAGPQDVAMASTPTRLAAPAAAQPFFWDSLGFGQSEPAAAPTPPPQTELTAWEPSVGQRVAEFFGIGQSNRDRASNELAARKIAKNQDVSVDQVFRDVGGQRPLFNPEGRPLSQAVPQAAGTIAAEIPRVPAAAANTVLRTIRGGDVGVKDDGFVDWAIRQTESPNTQIDPNYSSFDGLGESLGYSLTTLVTSATSFAATTAATGNPIAGGAAAFGTAGAVSYRASKDQFVSNVKDMLDKQAQKLYGRPLSEQEWAQARKDIESAATKYGAWEAVPESVSNLIFLKAFSLPARGLAKNRLADLTKKAAALASEQTTETITGVGQNRAELEVGLTEEELRVVDAFRQQFIQTLIVSGGMAGGVKATQAAKQFYQEKVEPAVAPGSALAKAIQADIDAIALNPESSRQAAVQALSPDNAQLEASPVAFDDLVPQNVRKPSQDEPPELVEQTADVSAGAGQAPQSVDQQLPAPQATFIDPPSSGQPAPSATQRVATVTGRQIDTQWEVVDADNLIAASDDLQPRDRTRVSSDDQIRSMAMNLDPARLGPSAEADRGAPIVGPDSIVESGNGRVQAIRMANRMFPERAVAYRNYLQGLGFDLQGIATPVLVRRRVTPFTDTERRDFVREANQSATMTLTPVEKAEIDARAMNDSVIEVWRGGEVTDAVNRDFVSAFVGQLPQEQRNEMTDAQGRLSPDGAMRIRRALISAAYSDRDLMSELMESADDNIRSIGNALFDSAGVWLQMRRKAEQGVIDTDYDVTQALVEAARVASQLRKQRASVADWLAQQDLTAPRDPVVDAFVRAFYNQNLSRAAGRDAINEVLQQYAQLAAAQDTQSMFGDPPSPVQMAEGAVEQRNARESRPAQQTGLFGQGFNDAGPGVQQGGRSAQPDAVQGDRSRLDGESKQGKPRSAENRGPAQSSQSRRTRDQAQPGQVSERTSRPDRDDAQAKPAGDKSRRKDDAPAERQSQKIKGATAGNAFRTASFTDRQSIYRDAFVELGLDPAEVELLPPVRQFQILSEGLKESFGLTFVQKSNKANIRESIDQLLDAFRGMQLMAHVLDLPRTSIGLNGRLGLVLASEAGFLGAYFPAGSDGRMLEGVSTQGPTIGLPGRSNSFAHEWGHAFDYYLLDAYQGVINDLSGYVRSGESLSDKTPENVRDSFKHLMNALFFDQAEQSARILDLERRIEASRQKGVEPTALAQELERLKSGASRSRQGKSEFAVKSAMFGESVGNADYWTEPTEMLARSFEAYIAHRVEAAGGTTEFITKGDYAYMSDAEPRLAMTFPKDADRFNIFRAYDLLFDAVRESALLNKHGDAVADLPPGLRLSDPAIYFAEQVQSAQAPSIKAVWDAEKRAWNVHARRVEREGNRPKDNRPVSKRVTDAASALVLTNRGVLLGLESQYGKTNSGAAAAIWEITKRIATDPGSGRSVFAGGTFPEAVNRETRRFMTRLANIQRMHSTDLFNDEELAQLSDVLTTIGDEASKAPTKIKEAAAPIRELLNDLFYYNRQSGMQLGFVEDQGYLPRILDEPVIGADESGFVKDAAQVYEIVFERDTERISDAQDVVKAIEALDARIREALLSKEDSALVEYQKAKKELRKLLRSLDTAEKSEDDTQDKVQKAQEDISEFLDNNADVFEEAYDYVKRAWGMTHAIQWHKNIIYGSPANFSSHSPASSYLLARALPPEADKILAKYYIQDPVDRVSRYITMAVRKAEYNRRFGTDARSPEKQAKIYQLEQSLIENRVSQNDRKIIMDIVAQSTGTAQNTIPHHAHRLIGTVHAIGQMTLLGRVVLTSLVESMTIPLQTGRPLDAFRSMGMLVQEMVNSKSAKDRRVLARAIGVVSGDLSDEIIANRLGGVMNESSFMARTSASFFRRVGLTGLTNAQRRSAMVLSGRYVMDMAHALDDAKANKKDKGFARDELLDAGLTEEDIDSFVQWSKEYSDRLPRYDELIDVDGQLTAMGRIYATMTGRLVDQAIQNPTAVDRPWAANTAVGRITFGLLSFNMAFFRNVFVKAAKKIDREYKKRGAAQATQVAAMQVLAPLAALYAGHLVVTVAREALLNPEKWAEEEEKEGGFPAKWLLSLAFSRSGFTGLADPIYNAFTGVKYQRDLANILGGATGSYFLQAIERIAKYFFVNSENTNSAERGVARGMYELAVQPPLAIAIGALPGGPLTGYGLGASYAYLSSPTFKAQWQDWLAGEADGKKSKTGQSKKDVGGF